jgi:serine protease Do
MRILDNQKNEPGREDMKEAQTEKNKENEGGGADGVVLKDAKHNEKESSKHKEGYYITKKLARGIIAVFCVSSLLFGTGGGIAADYIYNAAGGGTSEVLYEAVRTAAGSEGDSQGLSTAEVAQYVCASVVEIQTETVTYRGRTGQSTEQGAGSGVILTKDGYIVTNNHVIENVDKISVITSDGKEYSAAFVGADNDLDIAVIKISADNLTPAVLGDSSSLKAGDKAIIIGNPLGELGGTLTEGIISALDREITLDGQKMNLLQTDAAINPGNSGGGLFDGNAELVGIIIAKSVSTEVEGLGFAIPIDDIKTATENIISGKSAANKR